jgi:hypothetical protein
MRVSLGSTRFGRVVASAVALGAGLVAGGTGLARAAYERLHADASSVVSAPDAMLPIASSARRAAQTQASVGVEQVARFSCALAPYAATAPEWKYVKCGSRVPTGKALVIDYYTCAASNVASATILLQPQASASASIGASVPIPPGLPSTTLAEQAHIVATATEQVELALLASGSGNTSAQASFFGHYIDQ